MTTPVRNANEHRVTLPRSLPYFRRLQKAPFAHPHKILAFASPTLILANMLSPKFCAVLLLFTASSLATSTLEPRADSETHLYVCTDSNWRGSCKNIDLAVSRCYNMTPAFNDNVSSAGPDDGTFCVLYSYVPLVGNGEL